MKIKDATLLITGANRGIGLVFAREALARGARKVYAAARDPASVTLAGVVPVQLDVTKPDEISRVAAELGDVSILINNAGIADFGGFIPEGSLASARKQFEVNFFGMLAMSQSFAPTLAANGGGAILNVLSVASWINRPILGVYGASKSAAWALTNGLRHELRAQGTQVTALHMGFVDTDMAADIEAPKSRPEDIVRAAFDGFEAGADEMLGDEMTRQVKAGLVAVPPSYIAV